ncbi:hypothetical protein ACMAZF_14995 [Psychrobium sp. nBUS_13]|uniref:hypothetical protein n=1 Tax=Psychrobium sp. nBUS_13 TaxID=3395319 RepID=UPI003EB7660C
MKYFILTIIFFFFSNNAIAHCTGNSCTNVKITRIYVNPDNNTVISTSGDESKLNCDAGKNGYITLDPNGKNYNSTYSLLLTAHTTEHPIWVRTSAAGSCKVVYVVSDK